MLRRVQQKLGREDADSEALLGRGDGRVFSCQMSMFAEVMGNA